MVLFCAMPGSKASACSATALGALGCIAAIFYVKGNSVPVVVSVLLSWLGLRATLNGEVCTDEFSVAFRAGRTWNLDSISPSPLFFAVLRSLVKCCLREFGRFFGSSR